MNSRPSRPVGQPHSLVCPTCGRAFSSDQSSSLPFCSQRCQLVDLGRWLDEDIGLPHEGDPGDAPVEYRDPDAE
jgi:endogenous inhibitor of DNA gyrase (YacG/DUF329 family)